MLRGVIRRRTWGRAAACEIRRASMLSCIFVAFPAANLVRAMLARGRAAALALDREGPWLSARVFCWRRNFASWLVIDRGLWLGFYRPLFDHRGNGSRTE